MFRLIRSNLYQVLQNMQKVKAKQNQKIKEAKKNKSIVFLIEI